MKEILIVKRDGHKEALDLEKIHKVLFWATEGITGVSASEIEIKSHIQFYPGITTVDIHETLIKSAADLISEETPNYQYVAGRLINYQLRKEVYGQYEPYHIKDLVERNVRLGFYDKDILHKYSEEEWKKLDFYVKHKRDEDYTYAAMETWRTKYLVQNRVNGKILETPQMAIMLISATLFANYDESERLQWVKDYYDMVSEGYISLPTPVMAGVRTPEKNFASCVKIEVGDSLNSINASTASIVNYVSKRAGIGIGAGRLRAIKSPIRGGQAYHTGVTPFYRLFQSAVMSCSQGSVRKGSSTLFCPIWHYEIEDILVLKNNKGTDDSRVRHIDYGIQFNKLFYDRLITGGYITLFSPSDVTDLYDAFFNDQDLFKELYEKYERAIKIRKKKIKALDLFTMFMRERKDTGRVYLMNVDHCNTHSPFIEEKAPVRQSNLCVAGSTEIVIKISGKGVQKIQISDLGDYMDESPEVFSFNMETKKNEWKKITAFAQTSPAASVMKITDLLTNHFIVCTEDHGIFLKSGDYIPAKDIKSDSSLIFMERDRYSGVLTKETLETKIPVYDITVEDNHNFFANGILVHNCMEITLPTQPLEHLDDGVEDYVVRVEKNNMSKMEEYKRSHRNVLWKQDEKEGIFELIGKDFDCESFDLEKYHYSMEKVRHEGAASIALCTLSAINFGKIKSKEEFEKPCMLAVRGLDALLDYQNYPMPAAEMATMEYRSLGVGIINFAYWLAKNDLGYNEESLSVIDEYVEAWSYYLIKASADLAKEKGPCIMNKNVKYSKGILPIDTYKKDVDELVPNKERMPWNELREQLKKYGIRHGSLMAIMPSETSSLISNSTNGIEPIRSYITQKTSKSGVVKQVVPEFRRLKNKYDMLWEQKSPDGYIKAMAVIQKYVDQAISTNISINPAFYPDEKVSMKDMLQQLLMYYKYGGKNLYYHQTHDQSGEVNVDDGDDCESCKI